MIRTICEYSDEKYVTLNELETLIDSQDSDEVSDVDLIDDETGHVYLQVGQSYGEVKLPDEEIAEEDEDYVKEFYMPHEARYFSEKLSVMSDFYDIETENLADQVEDPQMMLDANYDVEIDVPTRIARLDHHVMTDNDVDVMKRLCKSFRSAYRNMVLEAHVVEGSNDAEFWVIYV
jgi:hypothetical protein